MPSTVPWKDEEGLRVVRVQKANLTMIAVRVAPVEQETASKSIPQAKTLDQAKPKARRSSLLPLDL